MFYRLGRKLNGKSIIIEFKYTIAWIVFSVNEKLEE